MSIFKKIMLFFVVMLSAPAVGAIAPTYNTQVQELRPETEGVFKRMLFTLSEDDWAQLGFEGQPWGNTKNIDVWLQKALHSWLSNGNKIMLTLTPNEKEVAGFAAYTIHNKNIWINCLAVSSAHRKQGHGRHLLETLKQKLSKGCKLGLSVYANNCKAQSLYCACGLVDKSCPSEKVRIMEYNQPIS